MIRVVDGDLLKASESVIGHQVNCFGVMGSGVARQVKARYPGVYAAYQSLCRERPEALLGECQLVSIDTAADRYVANLFGQQTYGKAPARYTDYEALGKALGQLHGIARERGLSVALSYKIGCDRGGGEWGVVLRMIEDIFTEAPVKLYRLEEKRRMKKDGE